MQETRGQSLGQEDFPGEGNGNPLQYPSLENSMDKGAWQATFHGDGRESDTTEHRYINYTLTYKKSSIRVTAYLRLSGLSIWFRRKQWDAHDKGQILTQPRSMSWRPLTEDSGRTPGPFQQTVLFSSWVIRIRKSAKIKHDGHHVTSLSHLKDQILFNCRLI